MYADAMRDTIRRFEDTGSPVISDGEQRKYHNFATYAVHGLSNGSMSRVAFRAPKEVEVQNTEPECPARIEGRCGGPRLPSSWSLNGGVSLFLAPKLAMHGPGTKSSFIPQLNLRVFRPCLTGQHRKIFLLPPRRRLRELANTRAAIVSVVL